MMSHLDEVLSPGLVVLDLEGKNKNEAIEEMAVLLEKEGRLFSREEYITKVYEREAVISTYCGSEVAIPHAVASAVKVPSVCFGRSEGLVWDNTDEWVCFVFLFAMPDDQNNAQHMAILSAIARSSLDKDTREMWLKATTAEQILESLQRSIAASGDDSIN